MRRLAGLVLLAELVVQPLPAQALRDTIYLTLDGALKRAILHSEEMLAAHAQVAAADGQVREAMAGALPQITGSLVYTRQFASIFETAAGAEADTSSILKLFKHTPFGAANAWNVQIQATQVLFSGGKIGAGLAAARAYRQSARSQESAVAADLSLAVTRAYWNTAAAARVAQIAEANLGQARDHERQVRLFHQAGMRAEYDLLRAQVEARNQEPAALAAGDAEDLALRELKRLVNIPADQPVTLDTIAVAAEALLPVVQPDTLAELDGAARPELAAADAAMRVQDQAVRIAESGRWPTLSLATTYSEQAFPGGLFPATNQFRRGWNGEVKLSFPIFLGFRTSGTISVARAGLAQAQARLAQVREQVAMDVAQARAELRRTQALLGARRETVRLAARTLHLALVRYGQALADEIEVADARVLALQAEVHEVQATRDYLIALAQLERAAGRPLPQIRARLDQIAGARSTKGEP